MKSCANCRNRVYHSWLGLEPCGGWERAETEEEEREMAAACDDYEEETEEDREERRERNRSTRDEWDDLWDDRARECGAKMF